MKSSVSALDLYDNALKEIQQLILTHLVGDSPITQELLQQIDDIATCPDMDFIREKWPSHTDSSVTKTVQSQPTSQSSTQPRKEHTFVDKTLDGIRKKIANQPFIHNFLSSNNLILTSVMRLRNELGEAPNLPYEGKKENELCVSLNSGYYQIINMYNNIAPDNPISDNDTTVQSLMAVTFGHELTHNLLNITLDKVIDKNNQHNIIRSLAEYHLHEQNPKTRAWRRQEAFCDVVGSILTIQAGYDLEHAPVLSAIYGHLCGSDARIKEADYSHPSPEQKNHLFRYIYANCERIGASRNNSAELFEENFNQSVEAIRECLNRQFMQLRKNTPFSQGLPQSKSRD